MNIHVFKGFLAAGAVPICAACIAGTVFNFERSGGFGGFVLSVFFAMLIAVPAAIAITLVIGVPAYCIANRIGCRSLTFYVISGAVISAAISALVALDIFTATTRDFAQIPLDYYTLAVALISGPLATGSFWMVARPDRVSEPAPDP